jgi:hypothetical protein
MTRLQLRSTENVELRIAKQLHYISLSHDQVCSAFSISIILPTVSPFLSKLLSHKSYSKTDEPKFQFLSPEEESFLPLMTFPQRTFKYPGPSEEH